MARPSRRELFERWQAELAELARQFHVERNTYERPRLSLVREHPVLELVDGSDDDRDDDDGMTWEV